MQSQTENGVKRKVTNTSQSPKALIANSRTKRITPSATQSWINISGLKYRVTIKVIRHKRLLPEPTLLCFKKQRMPDYNTQIWATTIIQKCDFQCIKIPPHSGPTWA